MRRIAIWSGVILALFVLARSASAVNHIAVGQVKSVNADKQEFVLTFADGKNFTFKLSDQATINRGGTESQSDLNAGDHVNVFYDKGILTWTAKYILIREGDSKDWNLAHGKLKSYDGEKQNFTYTNDDGTDLTYSAAFARVWVNKHEAAFEDLRIGDSVLLVIDREGGIKLNSVMCERKEN